MFEIRCTAVCQVFRGDARRVRRKIVREMWRFYQAKCNGIKYSPRETRLRFWWRFRARWLRVYFEANDVGRKMKAKNNRGREKKRRSFFPPRGLHELPEFSNLSAWQDRATRVIISVASSIKIQVCERGQLNGIDNPEILAKRDTRITARTAERR